MNEPQWIKPAWPAPANVRALSTTRTGGVSRAPFDTLNMGAHVGDEPGDVDSNRRRLREAAGLPAEPLWLSQVHGTSVADAALASDGCEADGAVSSRRGVVCAVLTADCLPVLLCNSSGTRVAAVHAGWRGMAHGVLESAVERLGTSLMAWLGPAIGPGAFEVGEEVRTAFLGTDPGAAHCFFPGWGDRWHADLYALARSRLERAGVQVFGGGFCTYTDRERFYSYRRDGRTGRMASLIWLEP